MSIITTSAPALPDPPRALMYDEVTLHFAWIIPGDPARGFVPYYHFRIGLGMTEIGHLNFRIGETEHLRLCAGHIGYEIAPAHRGHRYALQACHAVAPFVRLIYNEVLLTCDPDNAASRRTIDLLGARFLDEVVVPDHDPHYARGSRTKLRFLWRP